jgi:hypothetical protein
MLVESMGMQEDTNQQPAITPPSSRGREIIESSSYFGHMDVHTFMRAYCEEQVEMWRGRVGIEPIWSVEVSVRCPSMMGRHEASIWWDVECWYAGLEVSCGHSERMLDWLVVHELCELRRWRTSTHVFEVFAYMALVEDEGVARERERLLKGYHQARNQEIEWETFELLGHRRPFHVSHRSHGEEEVEEEEVEEEETV